MRTEIDSHHLLAFGQRGCWHLDEDPTLLVDPMTPRPLEAGPAKLDLDSLGHAAHKVEVARGVGATGVQLDRASPDQDGDGFPFLFIEESLEPLGEGSGSRGSLR